MPTVSFQKQFAGTKLAVVEQKMDDALTALRGDGSKAAQKSRSDVQDVFGEIRKADKNSDGVLSEAELKALKPREQAFVKSAVHAMIELKTTRANGVPKSWKLIEDPARELKKIDTENDGLSLRLKSGRTLDVDVNDVNRELLPQLFEEGYLQLYVNPKDDSQPDDETGKPLWSAGYYLVPTKKFDMLDKQIESRAKNADAITKEISSEMDTLDRKMHASNVNNFAQSEPGFSVQKLKDAVAAEIPKAKDAIVKDEQAVKAWKGNNQLLDYPEGGINAEEFAQFELDKAAPTITSISMDDLVFVKDLIRASEILMKRPEVQAVDPGEGIRVQVDTDTLVANGGDFNQMKADVAKQMKDALITEPLEIEKNNSDAKVTRAAQDALAAKIGADNVVFDQLGGSEGNNMKTITLYVKQPALAQAQAQIPDLLKLFAPHGYDSSNFGLKIEAAT